MRFKITLRVFNYGYQHAVTEQTDPNVFVFPKPIIVYLYRHKAVADCQKLLMTM